VAWIDDAHDERCDAWASARPGPTLLLTTDPATGLTGEHVERLLAWAEQTGLAGHDRVDGRKPLSDGRPGGPRVA